MDKKHNPYVGNIPNKGNVYVQGNVKKSAEKGKVLHGNDLRQGKK